MDFHPKENQPGGRKKSPAACSKLCRWWNRGFRVPIMGLFLLVFTAVSVSAGDELAWHDREYLEQLVRNDLSDLADIYASQRRDRCRDSDDKARWQLFMARQARRQIWLVPSGERAELLAHHLQGVLNLSRVQDARLHFHLQTESTRMLVEESKASLLVTEASTLYPDETPPAPASLKTRLQQFDEELKRLEKALRDLDSNASTLPRSITVDLRSEAKLLRAEVLCQKLFWSKLTGTAGFHSMMNETIQTLKSDLRSVRSAEIKTKLRILLATVTARYGSEKDFLLLAAPLWREFPADLAEARVRYALRKQQPGDAARYLEFDSSFDQMRQQKRHWLNTEIVIGQIDQAKRLRDESLVNATLKKIEVLKHRYPARTSGAYLDAARICLTRAEVIANLGSELASRLKNIDRLQQLGELKQASQLIRSTLDQLPANSIDPARSAMLLKATEIYLQDRQWEDAEKSGQLAADGYERLSLPDKAAAADLLRCYALAQQMSDGTETSSRYEAALRDHLQRFPTAETSATAMSWLVKLLERSSPVEAVDLSLARLEPGADATSEARLVAETNDLIWNLLLSDSGIEYQQLSNWLDRIRKIKRGPAFHPATTIALSLLVERPSDAELTKFWQELESSKEPREFRNVLLQLVISAKLSTDTNQLEQQRSLLLDENSRSQQQAIFFLSSFVLHAHAEQQIRSGDVFLCRTVDRLIMNVLQATSDDHFSRALAYLPTIVASASVTGDQLALDAVLTKLSLEGASAKTLESMVPELKKLSHIASTSSTLQAVLLKFWKRVLRSSSAGSNNWLEGLVQLGTLATESQDRSLILKQFRTANVLYPEWGSPERKVRAARVFESLQE